MHQYNSKSKAQSEKSNANTSAANKNHMQAEKKMSVQTKSLFSPSFNRENIVNNQKPVSAKQNNTGIPTQMKERFENLSGFSFDDVKVHYNSDKPAQLQALAYTQGNQVYVASGQEKHLGHELGHVVQQKQGCVMPTGRLNGFRINCDQQLESNADLMSNAASTYKYNNVFQETGYIINSPTLQMQLDDFDIDAIRDSTIDADIRQEIINIYDNNRDHINYGRTARGGGARFINGNLTAVIENRRGLLSRLFSCCLPENVMSAIVRQSTIMHELTHLAVMRFNRQRDAELRAIDNPDQNLLQNMTSLIIPQGGDVGGNHQRLIDRITVLNDDLENVHEGFQGIRHNFGGRAQTLYDWVASRLAYASFTPELEYPAVINELFFLLSSINQNSDNDGISGSQIYAHIQGYAQEALQARGAR